MLNLKKITTTVSLLSLGALSVALFSTGCDSGTSSGAGGAGGAGGKSSVGGAGGKSSAGGAGGKSSAGGAGGAGGSAGGHGGTTQATGGHGGAANGGAAGSAAGGAAGSAAGGAAGSAAGGAGGHSAGGAAGGHGGTAAGGAGGHSAGGAGGEATTIVYNITLTGAMEVLPQGTAVSTATGSAMVTLDTVAMTATVAGSFTGLSAPANLAHIHGPAAPGMSANQIVTLTASAATAGAISGSGPLTAQQVLDMKNGLTYVNVHSAGTYGAGEIRGQIQ